MAKVIVFLDALDPRECVDWLSETKQGRVISGIPRVTPPIIGSFLTGKSPGEHGLVRPTPLYRPQMNRPKGDTIIDLAAKRGRVLSFMIPFTLGVDPPNAIVAQSGMAGEGIVPLPVLRLAQSQPEPTDCDPEQMLQCYVDHVRNVFATIRQLMRNDVADTYFISIREIDAFTHWFYETDCRQRLIQYIGFEMSEFPLMGSDLDLLWFSDHGGCPKTGRFEINRWFIEKGYLKITYLQKRHEKMMEQQQKAGQKIFKDQVGVQTPLVQIEDGSKFVSADLFDACVDVLDASESEIEKLRDELLATGYFKAVYRKHELFPGCNGDDDIPEIIPDRKDGLLVSCNVHPRAEADDADEIVNLRSGDHSPFGCYGGTKPFGKSGDILPTELYQIAEEMTKDIKPKEEKAPALTSGEQVAMTKQLEKMGYA